MSFHPFTGTPTRQVLKGLLGVETERHSISCPVALMSVTHTFSSGLFGICIAAPRVSMLRMMRVLVEPILQEPSMFHYLLRHKHNLHPKLLKSVVLHTDLNSSFLFLPVLLFLFYYFLPQSVYIYWRSFFCPSV